MYQWLIVAGGETASSLHVWGSKVAPSCPQELDTRPHLERHESSLHPHAHFSRTDKIIVQLRIQREP
jgi:hypothetical protein